MKYTFCQMIVRFFKRIFFMFLYLVRYILFFILLTLHKPVIVAGNFLLCSTSILAIIVFIADDTPLYLKILMPMLPVVVYAVRFHYIYLVQRLNPTNMGLWLEF